MRNPYTPEAIDAVIDATERQFNGIPSTVNIPTTDRVHELCRNCGRQMRSTLEQYCGQPDCEERAATHRTS